MAHSILSVTQCFQAGDDLWIVAEYENSKLTQKIDWYLNFQISKSQLHHRPIVSDFLESVVEQCELPKFTMTDKNVLMIAPQGLLPTQWVVVVPALRVENLNALQTWREQVDEVWQNLGRPKTRVFLPAQFSIQDVLSSGPQLPDEFSLVVDPAG